MTECCRREYFMGYDAIDGRTFELAIVFIMFTALPNNDMALGGVTGASEVVRGGRCGVFAEFAGATIGVKNVNFPDMLGSERTTPGASGRSCSSLTMAVGFTTTSGCRFKSMTLTGSSASASSSLRLLAAFLFGLLRSSSDSSEGG